MYNTTVSPFGIKHLDFLKNVHNEIYIQILSIEIQL